MGSDMISPRILFVRNSRGITDVTGAETYLLTLIEGLHRAGCAVELLCAVDARQGETPWLKTLRARGLPYRTVDVPSKFSIADLRAGLERARSFKADVIHAMDHRSDTVAVLLSLWFGIPAVASFFGWTNWEKTSARARLYPAFDRLIMRRLKRVIVDSAFIGSQIRSTDAVRQVAVIPNGVDMQRFDADSVAPTFKQRWFGRDDVTLIGTIGRIHPNKGHIDLARAAGDMLSRNPNLRFVIIGDPPPGHEDYARELDKVLAETGIGDQFLITNVPSAEIPDAIASFDITAMPSYMESLSYVMLESMAMKTPVISARVGGHGELIEDGQNGFLIEPGDVGALTRKLETLIADPELRVRIGEAGQRKVRAEYSIEAMVARTCAVYEEVMTR